MFCGTKENHDKTSRSIASLWTKIWTRDLPNRVRVPAGAGNFSLHHRVQTGSGAHPSFCAIDVGVFIPWRKTAGTERDAYHWNPSTAEICNSWSLIPCLCFLMALFLGANAHKLVSRLESTCRCRLEGSI